MVVKKEKKEKTESKGKFQDTLDHLNEVYGKGTILALDSKTDGEYDVISTGSIAFDWITLGVGGFVKGKFYELMGWEGVGKSSICGHAVAECQKKGGKTVYIDGEHAFDKIYFQALGVDTSKMLIAQPSSGEEGFSIAKDMINTGEIDLLIIDSDSSMIPKCVIEGEVGDSAIGKKARLNNSVYPAIKSLLAKNKTCVIVVSQYREKIGVMYGCLHGDTLINFTDGRSIPIKKVVESKIKGKVFCVNEENDQIEEKEIVDWHFNGKVQTKNDYIHVETSGLDGQNTIGFTVTPNHKLLTDKEWKSAETLELSDKLVSKYKSVLNSSLADFLYGSFVGDCSIVKRDKTTANIRFQDRNNPEYLNWKIKKLSKYLSFTNKNEVYQSEYNSEFKIVQDEYPKRDTNAFFDNYSNLGLAVWFMDDVHFDNKNGHSRYILSIKRFKDNLDKLQEIVVKFNKGMNIKCCSRKDGSIIFNKEDSLYIAERIYKYIPDCMQYKLPKQFRDKYEDFELFCERTVKPRYVKINSIRFASDKQMKNKGKYDLTIEDNSNYLVGGVKNGIIVHNSPTCTQGGHALKFYTDCRIEISKSLAKEGEEVYGNLTKIKATKNKMASPYKSCHFDIVYGQGIDKIAEIFELGVEYFIIEKNGPMFSYNGLIIGRGKEQTKSLLLDNPELAEEIKQKIIDKISSTGDPVEEIITMMESNEGMQN